jgi:CDP-diacylglycerol--glycerol-3-phosphate 3-phosphatidyltransferase
MTNLPDATSESEGRYCSGEREYREVLQRLRHESRGATLLLLFPWLWTILYCWPILYVEPLTIIGLVPGLAVVVYIHRHLYHHLVSNHSHLEEGRLFATLGAANWITLLRAAAIVGVAGVLPLSLQPDLLLPTQNKLAWVPGIIYLVISILDLLDGYVARRQGRETELGKQLDIATDAAGLLVASLLAVVLGRLPPIYLLVGVAYYPFVFGIWLRQRRAMPLVALQSRPYARIIAGCQMGLVAMALLPIFKPTFTYLAAYIFMIPLLSGFLRDWLVVSCQIKTNADQQSSLDRWMRSLARKPLPLALRIIILTCGITTLAIDDIFQTHLFWILAYSFCCLLAVVGFMGRSAALLLILLLASNQSPFGITVLSETLFAAAAALVLTGTGTMSLWVPEETILYRRNKGCSTSDCEAL